MASNKRRRHTPDQIIRELAEGNKLLGAGQELGEVCRHLEIAESTWHRWLAQYGGIRPTRPSGSKSSRPRTLGSRSWSPTRPSTSTCSRRFRRETSDPEPQAQRRAGVVRPV